MLWHQGSIPEAVTAARDKKLLLVVFVRGNDEHSTKMEDSLSDQFLSETLDPKSVALKLDKNSEGAKQFSQIYPVVVIPSLYFIEYNGIPLEILGGYVPPTQLLEKIHHVIELHEKEVSTSTGEVNVSGTKPISASSVTPQSTATEATAYTTETNQQSDVQTPSSSSVSSTEEDSQPSIASTSEINLEDRVERAKVLVAQRQAEKADEEFEKSKQQEIERRKLGKQMIDFKQKQKEKEHKSLADEIAREKAEDQAARERVRQQIARDRAEKANKFQVEKETEVRKQEALQAERTRSQTAETANKSNFARLQLKLPDGSAVVQQFTAETHLQEVYNFVKDTVKPPFVSFRLCVIFPRRDFNKGDYSQTLRDLQLVPNASLLILPESNKSVTPAASNSNILWLLLSPFFAVWNYLRYFIYGNRSDRPVQSRDVSSGAASSGSNESGRPEIKRQRLSPTADSNRPFTRREGNVHRIANGNDDDEENNTWNGNSTQQM
ncbi:UBX domain-containing protein 4 [Chamberlinius hualienensis]